MTPGGRLSNVRQLSIRERAWITIGLIIGFYASALLVAAGLVLIPLIEWVSFGVLHVKLAAACGLAALAVLWGIMPRRDRFEPPGPTLDRSAQPRLFAEIDGVAAKMGQRLPEEVYLVGDMNAFVAERGGVLGWGSRRIMGIGLPLLQMLTVSQLRAVLAHEFGHYAGDDTRLGPWLYKAREDMGRTIASFEEGTPLHAVFSWYGHLFLRITQAFSREQEFAADLWAANLYGSKAIGEGLKACEWGARCYELYWRTELEPLLEAGFLPPIGEGFARFGASAFAEKAVAEMDSQPAEPDPYDSHPVLQERLDALAGLPEPAGAGEDGSAISLLDDPSGLEALLTSRFEPAPGAPAFAPLAWTDAGHSVYLPQWQQVAREQAEAMKGVTAGELPKLLEDWGWFVHRFKDLPEDLDEDGSRRLAQTVVGSALGAALFAQGWKVTAMPGEQAACVKDGLEIKPFEAAAGLISRELKASAWKATCKAAGIEALSLGPGARAAAGRGPA